MLEFLSTCFHFVPFLTTPINRLIDALERKPLTPKNIFSVQIDNYPSPSYTFTHSQNFSFHTFNILVGHECAGFFCPSVFMMSHKLIFTKKTFPAIDSSSRCPIDQGGHCWAVYALSHSADSYSLLPIHPPAARSKASVSPILIAAAGGTC